MLPERLAEGYRSFLNERFPNERTRYEKLAESGQKPDIMVIGCCDSRVSPEVIFDASPGELFVVRNVANLVPPYEIDTHYHGTSAALEYAVQVLQVKHIVVLGHARCGGVSAFVDPAAPLSEGGFIGKWMTLIAPAAERIGPRAGREQADYITRLEFAAIENSLANLMSFPRVRTLVQERRLALHGAYFGVANGRLLVCDRETGEFRAIAAT
jgi:carbonic anhydrase